MKNFKSIIAILAISVATVFSSYAANENPVKIKNDVRSEIISILGTQTSIDISETSSAYVFFTINDNHEIVVLSVDSENAEFSAYVKSKLNYKKLDTKGLKIRAMYKLPVTLKNK